MRSPGAAAATPNSITWASITAITATARAVAILMLRGPPDAGAPSRAQLKGVQIEVSCSSSMIFEWAGVPAPHGTATAFNLTSMGAQLLTSRKRVDVRS
jgi:hypothetical protein